MMTVVLEPFVAVLKVRTRVTLSDEFVSSAAGLSRCVYVHHTWSLRLNIQIQSEYCTCYYGNDDQNRDGNGHCSAFHLETFSTMVELRLTI